jgi:hypothetical protein
MAKGRANSRGKSGEKPSRKWWSSWLFYSAMFLVLIVALLFWQWSVVTSWVSNITSRIWGLFGWGLILIALAVIITIGIISRRQLSTLVSRWKLYQWNKWLGGIAFILAIWGVLALFNLGGSFGLGIVGQEDFIAILWILGLVIIGAILVAPPYSKVLLIVG